MAMTLKQRGVRAASIIRDDVFIDAINAVDEQILKEFKACSTSDTENILELKRLQVTLVNFIQFFETAMKTGQMEDGKLINIEKERKWRNLMKR